MKGIVFTSFFDFCESRYGADLLDEAIERANLAHGGAYTSVGTYPFEEMVALITGAVQLTGSTMPAMLQSFGEFCFAAWVKRFPEVFDGKDLFDVLTGIDDFHETQVRKLYPDAELPSFGVERRNEGQIILHYRSCKPLADLAVGVIRGAGLHMGTPVEIVHRPIGGAIEFEITRASARLAA